MSFQIEPCAAGDHIAHGFIVSRGWGFELSPRFVNPKTHRNALAGDEIFLAHFSARRRTGLHLFDCCIRFDGWSSGKIDLLAGFETVADPVSVRSDSSSASLSLTRFFDSALVFTQPDPRSSPVKTLLASRSSSCCCRLACSCLHQAMNRSGADIGLAFLLDHSRYVLIM